jgi:hypothetical protein
MVRKARGQPPNEPLPSTGQKLKIFTDARQLLALEPEEPAGALIEIIPDVSQSAGFHCKAHASAAWR